MADYFDDGYDWAETQEMPAVAAAQAASSSEPQSARISETDLLVSPLFPEHVEPANPAQTHLLSNPSLQRGFVPYVTNIVSKFTFGCPIDLKAIAMRARNCEYNPKRFNGMVMRSTNPKLTINMFTSGKAICMGADSEKAAYDGCRRAAKIVQHCLHRHWQETVQNQGNPQASPPPAPRLHFREFAITNMVACFDCGFPIDLDGVADEFSDIVTVRICFFFCITLIICSMNLKCSQL